MSECHPAEWIGLGFVATIENASAETLSEIDGISAVAAQIVWGLEAQKPEVMDLYLDHLADWDLRPVGWGWCDAEDPAGARAEGYAHAQVAADLELHHFIANMEESYDAHGDVNSLKWDLPRDYCRAFREILPDIHFAVTTTPRWASNHQALQRRGGGAHGAGVHRRAARTVEGRECRCLLRVRAGVRVDARPRAPARSGVRDEREGARCRSPTSMTRPTTRSGSCPTS